MILGRRGYSVVGGKQARPRLIRLGWLEWAGLRRSASSCCSLPVFLPYGALLNAAFSPIATTLVTSANATLHNINFVFFELSATKLALKNTFILGIAAATLGTVLALVIAYLDRAQGGARLSRARLSRHRADRHSRHRARRRAVPELHAAALRALRHALDPAARLSSPSSCRPPISSCSRPSAPCIRSWRTPAASSAPRGCRRCARSPRRCCAPA